MAGRRGASKEKPRLPRSGLLGTMGLIDMMMKGRWTTTPGE